MPRIISWFSCGAASAIATKLALAEHKAQRRNEEFVVAYCETGAEHEDNERFLRECEAWFGQSIVRLKNQDYQDTWALWEDRRYLAGIDGAPCTVELKVVPRLEFQLPDDIHVFGYTADRNDAERAPAEGELSGADDLGAANRQRYHQAIDVGDDHEFRYRSSYTLFSRVREQ